MSHQPQDDHHCANCGKPIEDVESARKPGEWPDDPEAGPVHGGTDRIYCTLGCAAEKQGWLYD